ncbi:MAG: hypothetical protein HFH27_12040 [Clostridiaceae bacterium]|nr:hypothetical protein [Clostridiaceae bacterium]MCI9485169.1 hypothetical protein [Clostridiaceae bacterium]
MTSSEIIKMLERQLGRLEEKSQEAEYARALSGLTETMQWCGLNSPCASFTARQRSTSENFGSS